MKRIMMAALAAAMAGAAPMGQARAENDLWDHVINMETSGRWNVSQERPAPRVVDSEGVPGGAALRVRIGRAGANPWDVQATSPTGGDIAAGDVVLVAFYARAEEPAEGDATRINVRLQLSGAPYTAMIETQRSITREWRQHCAWAVAGQNFRGDLSNVSLHLATGRHVIDLGPVFVFNLGPDFDRSQLPNCG